MYKRAPLCFTHKLVQELNTNQIGLRFTSESDKCKLAFLDVKITINSNSMLDTRLFRKMTATNALLRWESHHPAPLKRGIPRAQYLRVRRNCSSPATFRTQAFDLRERFRDRGYPDEVLDPAFRNALSKDRRTLLHSKKKSDGEDTLRIIGTYDNQVNQVFSILRKHWNILQTVEILAGIIPNKPQITFHRGRSLRDRLVHSHYKRPKHEGTWLDRQICGTFNLLFNLLSCLLEALGRRGSASAPTHGLASFLGCAELHRER
ncbi:unnamed protein product [Ranitomeya imitator]|uniref:Helix-turn-helix domain-containing protein n=1 Tax=Ranitomeya imitator TaxID=111125 RepID=A0ABN9LD07_9NEOB|nr:unnamed protein product [Ranitomeya imitator]